MNPAHLLHENREVLERLVTRTARRHYLSQPEQRRFAAFVNEHVAADDFRLIRDFQNRSSFSTYLGAVVHRLSFDFRVQIWEGWRPSPIAERTGPAAVVLERLISRDGHSLSEAVRIVRDQHEVILTSAELIRMWLAIRWSSRG